jgi:hypothetical protein
MSFKFNVHQLGTSQTFSFLDANFMRWYQEKRVLAGRQTGNKASKQAKASSSIEVYFCC